MRYIYQVPKNVRPTSSKVFQAVFNIINAKFDSFSLLDLFAGSGKIALEAVYQKATNVVVNDIKISKELLENLSVLDPKSYTLMNYDFHRLLKYLKKNNLQFDVVYLDPPFFFNDYLLIVDQIIDFNILTDRGIIILEHAKSKELTYNYQYKRHIYGQVVLDVISKEKI